jgi:hypothetical protein
MLLVLVPAGKAIAPIYEQLAKQYPGVKFLKVDIDNDGLSQVVQEHGITGVVRRSSSWLCYSCCLLVRVWRSICSMCCRWCRSTASQEW